MSFQISNVIANTSVSMVIVRRRYRTTKVSVCVAVNRGGTGHVAVSIGGSYQFFI